MAAIVAAGIAASGLAFHLARAADEARVRADLDLQAEWRAKDIEHKIDDAAFPVQAAATFVASQNAMRAEEAEEFRKFAIQARGGQAPIRSIAWVPQVARDQRAQFESGARAMGLADFRILEPGANHTFVPAQDRAEYYPVLFHVGFEGQASVVGVDLGSAKARRDPVLRARDTGRGAASGQLGMLTLGNDDPSYLVAFPIYSPGGVPSTVEERRARFRGVVYGAFQLRRMLSAAIEHTPDIRETIAFSFGRSGDPSSQQIVAVYSPSTKVIGAAPSGDDPTKDAAYRAVRSFEIMGQSWTLTSGFSEDVVAAQRSAAPLAVLLAGLLLTAALGAYVARERWQMVKIKDVVALQTADLHLGNTALKSVETELQRTNTTMSTLLENLPIAVSLVGPDQRFLAFNNLFREEFGCSPDELKIGDSFETFIRLIKARGLHGRDDTDSILRQRLETATTRRPERFEVSWPGGRTVDVRIAPLPSGGFVTARIDITRVKQAQAEAEAARARMADWTTTASDWFWESDAEGKIAFLSDSFEAATGVKVADRMGTRRLDLQPGDRADDPKWQAHLAGNAAHRPFRDFILEMKTPARTLHLSVSGKPVFDASGRFTGYRGTTRNVTAQVDAERALERQTNTLSTLIENLPIGVALLDRELRLVAFNQPYFTTLGLPAHFVEIGDPVEKVVRHNAGRGDYGPGETEAVVCDVLGTLRAPQQSSYEMKQGSGQIVEISARPLASGGLVSTFTDITERRRRETELEQAHKEFELQAAELKQMNFDLRREVGKREEATSQLEAANAKLQALVDASPLPIVSLDTRRRVVTWNRAAERHFGYAASDVMGRAYPLVPPEGEVEFDALFERSKAGEHLRDIAVKRRHKDGRVLDVVFSGSPLYNADHRLVGVVYVLEDVTDKKKIETQIAQAVKMDAVGQLTGGIAHDFNNLLGIVIGNLDQQIDTLDNRPAAADEIKALGREALDAALRGAELVRRLLAFSRSQPLQPKVIEVGTITREVEPLLWRALGEHVTLETRVANDLWKVSADPTQLENVIVNLAINARDAMPNGGHIKIICANRTLDAAAAESAELPAGDYVAVSVSDTGTGIPPDVLARVFEPFFTTKEVGKGSGLGLSMVYGFARQSGGGVRIYSEVGRGTEVRVYLPRAHGDVAASGTDGDDPSAGIPSGHERVLLVEDKAEVRAMAARLLTSLGYQILEAESGVSALELVKRGATFDVLFTDIVMPGNMTGIDLAHEVRRQRPGLPILLTSGFSDPETLHAEATALGVQVLRKPYRKAELAEYLRAALDRAAARVT
ncbi:MAG TPA: PAS-domain containing protein [Alphaproteobacteria bacterium]|nr:PAS-domain containing protein [Alphaproteobacteria bacterium]